MGLKHFDMEKKSQADRLLELLLEGRPVSTIEIQRVVYGGEHLGTARIASRVSDLREKGYVIDSAPGKQNKTVWWYLLKSGPEKVEKPEPVRYVVDRWGRRMTIEEYQKVYA